MSDVSKQGQKTNFEDDLPPPPPPPPPPTQAQGEGEGEGQQEEVTAKPPPDAAAAGGPPPPVSDSDSLVIDGPPPRSASSSSDSSGSSSPIAPSARSSGVSQLAAMLQASMLKQPLTTTIPEVDSDSDEEDGMTPQQKSNPLPSSPGADGGAGKKLSASSSSSFSGVPTHLRWEVQKANRYGLKDSRLVVLDLAGHAIRFFDGPKLKSEVPLNQIATALRKDTKRVEMSFKEDRRCYELIFQSDQESAEFQRLVSAELDISTPSPLTRSYSQSVHTLKNAGSVSTNVPPSPSSSTQSRSHLSHNSMSGNSFSQTRDPSESIAIHSEVGGLARGATSDYPTPTEDHNAYLDYAVYKKNRYGMRQQRILVINAHSRTMLLLDDKRKFKKEFGLASILSVEIPKSNPKEKSPLEAQCFVVFSKEAGQKPFHLFFGDSVDRIHFCDRLVSLAPHELSIKDESDSVEDEDSFRFGILKLNKVGVKKKRIIVLRTKEQVLRSFNREKSYKDVSFRTIVKWEKPLEDRFRLNVFLLERPHPLILIFPDPIARERFVCQCNYIRAQLEEDASLAAAAASPVTDATVSPASPFVAAPPPSAGAPLSIFIGSWNLGNSSFQYESLNDFIPPMKYDLYVLGLQELSKGDREQWLQELRNHIQQDWKGASGAGSNGSSNGLASGEVEGEEESKQPYALLGVVKLWEIVMMVLIRRPLVSKVSNLCMDTVASGIADVMGNKGGCGLSFTYQDTNLCFVACHLAARAERIVQRAENYRKILTQLQLGLPNVDILSQMDHVFWLGDLNYRNDLEFSEVIQLVRMKDWKLLTTYDQLLSQMSKQLVFAGFEEGLVRFAPTYRWERKENQFSNKKFQAPSWTDRVLWHSLPGLADLKLDKYDSAPNVMGSDHRPIYATFTLHARPAYTGRLSKQPNQPIHITHHENTNLITPDNAAFAAAASTPNTNPPSASSSPASSPAATMPNSASPLAASVANFNSPSKSVCGPTPTKSPSTSAAAILTVPGAGASGQYQHYSLAAPALSVVSRPSNVGGAGSTPTSKGFTPYVFHAQPKGPLFAPPTPTQALFADRPPLIGTTRDFTIVLQQVKCTLSNAPRGDFTLTASAPFLHTWPTTTAVSYPFGLEVGCHWDEIVLPPFIHDLYYLYSRHIMLSISVPSLAASTNGVNVEQTGLGTCIGTVTIGIGTVCKAIFDTIAANTTTTTHANDTGNSLPLQARPFNPLMPQSAGPHATTTVKPTNPNSPGLTGDQGACYFIEPIYREGLYAGQLEGRILFRYKSPQTNTASATDTRQ